MSKLISAQFGMDSTEDFKKVLTAFVSPFPSIKSLPPLAEELVNFLFTGEYSPKIQEAIDEDSCDGEWPGKVFLTGQNVGNGWKIKEMVIQPYVGDRILIVRDFRTSPVWPTIFCEADYSARPSEGAASEIIDLHNSGDVFCWNPAVWENAT
jgi:hypothetical protein